MSEKTATLHLFAIQFDILERKSRPWRAMSLARIRAATAPGHADESLLIDKITLEVRKQLTTRSL
jgi:hypothetical protein